MTTEERITELEDNLNEAVQDSREEIHEDAANLTNKLDPDGAPDGDNEDE